LQKFWHTCPLEPGYLNAVELKDPRPAPPDNGPTEEKPRPQDIPPPGMVRNPGPHFD